MTRKVQRGVSLFPSMWEKVYALFPKLNMSTHSDLVEDAVLKYLKEHENMLPEPLSDKVEKEMAIGQIADRRKSRKFSLIRAGKDLEDDEEGLKKLLGRGLITQEQYDEQLKESIDDHKKVIQAELSKKYNNVDDVPKPDVKRTEKEEKAMRKEMRMKMYNLNEKQHDLILTHAIEQKMTFVDAHAKMIGTEDDSNAVCTENKTTQEKK